jgi:ATP synthase protein I
MSPLWSARFRKAAKARIRAFGWEHGEHSIVPDPDDLRALGKRLDEVRRQNEPRREEAPPTSLGIASRFATEFVVAVAFDRWLGTRPIFLLVLFVLGAAAGMRNVMRAAAKINAEQAASQKDDKEI